MIYTVMGLGLFLAMLTTLTYLANQRLSFKVMIANVANAIVLIIAKSTMWATGRQLKAPAPWFMPNCYSLDQQVPVHINSATWYTAPSDQVRALLHDLEVERMRLSAVGVALLGYFDEKQPCHPEYRSSALEDALSLYKTKELLRLKLESLQGK